MSGPDNPENPRAYVRAVIGAYVRLPATPARARREDRRVASELHARGLPLSVVEAGLLLGAVRKAKSLTEATALTTIRSLCYFVPVIEEILADPPSESYIDYLRDFVDEWRQASTAAQERRQAVPAPVQKTTVLDER